MRVPVAPSPAVSDVAFISSTIHITIPPISSELPMMYKLSKCFPITLVAFRKGSQELRDPFTKINRQAKNRAQLNHDRIHLPVAARQAYVEKGFGNPQMRRRADGQKFRQSFNDS
jgi:hypothetical protein